MGGGMSFEPRFEELPRLLPIFPLTGVLLLPRGRLPLNIFEPRYLAMTLYALAHDRMIGMIQPQEGAGDAGSLHATRAPGAARSGDDARSRRHPHRAGGNVSRLERYADRRRKELG